MIYSQYGFVKSPDPGPGYGIHSGQPPTCCSEKRYASPCGMEFTARLAASAPYNVTRLQHHHPSSARTHGRNIYSNRSNGWDYLNTNSDRCAPWFPTIIMPVTHLALFISRRRIVSADFLGAQWRKRRATPASRFGYSITPFGTPTPRQAMS